jgi:hypothetical protein
MSGKKYDEADGEFGANGEARLRQYIRSCNYEANKHPHGIYGEDIEYVSATERFYADVERRSDRTWTGKDWMRWPTLHVLARRKVAPGVLFFTMSSDMTKAYVSFPEDLATVNPIQMDNVHAKGEQIRDHEILRCLPLDLTKPIDGSIASMNAARVRDIVRNSTSYAVVMRTLRGREPYGFGSPYGISDDEWQEMLLDVERRSGLGEYVTRTRKKTSQPSLF